MDKNIKLNLSHCCESILKTGYIKRPNYKNWLARTKWTVFEASCLFDGIDLPGFYDLCDTIEAYSPNDSTYEHGFIAASEFVVSDIRRKIPTLFTDGTEINR